MQIDPYLLSPFPVPIPSGTRSESEADLRPLGQAADDPLLGDESEPGGATTPDETPALITALGPTRGMTMAVVEAAAGLLGDGQAPGEGTPSPELPGSGGSSERGFPKLDAGRPGPVPVPDTGFGDARPTTVPGGEVPETVALTGAPEPAENGRVSQVQVPGGGGEAPVPPETAPDSSSPDPRELTDEQKGEVEELKKRDREVRQHEQAHVAAGGQYVRGGPQYEYTTGPDQHQYATGGEVSIDTSEVPDDPEATVRKAQVVYRAALAPAEPSPQDQRVASEAKQMESEARQEVATERREEAQVAGEETVAETVDAEGEPSTGEAEGSSEVGAPGAAEGGGPSGGHVADPVGGLDTSLVGTTGEAGQLVDLLA